MEMCQWYDDRMSFIPSHTIAGVRDGLLDLLLRRLSRIRRHLLLRLYMSRVSRMTLQEEKLRQDVLVEKSLRPKSDIMNALQEMFDQ